MLLLEKLCSARGVAGDEGEIRKLILDIVTPLSDNVRVDRMGNIIAEKLGTKDAPDRVMVCAHMDEVGFIITGITEDGLARIAPITAIDPRVVVSKRVHVGKNKIDGVIGAKAIHLQSRAELNTASTYKDLYIDIGADDKASAEGKISPGDYVTFDSDIVYFGNDRIKARALDDRVGCLSLIRLLENRYADTLICVFTTQEEVGCRGAVVAAHSVAPDRAIILEGTAAADMGMNKPHRQVCVQTRGVAVSFMDNSSIANKALFKDILKSAEKHGISHQLKRGSTGGNDAGPVHQSRGGVPTVVLSVPCRYIHSPSSTACLSDIRSQYLLVDAYMNDSAENA